MPTLHVTAVDGTGLPLNTFLQLTVGNDRRCTDAITNTNPQWNQLFEFHVPDTQGTADERSTLAISLCKCTGGDTLFVRTIPLLQMQPNAPLQFPLQAPLADGSQVGLNVVLEAVDSGSASVGARSNTSGARSPDGESRVSNKSYASKQSSVASSASKQSSMRESPPSEQSQQAAFNPPNNTTSSTVQQPFGEGETVNRNCPPSATADSTGIATQEQPRDDFTKYGRLSIKAVQAKGLGPRQHDGKVMEEITVTFAVGTHYITTTIVPYTNDCAVWDNEVVSLEVPLQMKPDSTYVACTNLIVVLNDNEYVGLMQNQVDLSELVMGFPGGATVPLLAGEVEIQLTAEDFGIPMETAQSALNEESPHASTTTSQRSNPPPGGTNTRSMGGSHQQQQQQTQQGSVRRTVDQPLSRDPPWANTTTRSGGTMMRNNAAVNKGNGRAVNVTVQSITVTDSRMKEGLCWVSVALSSGKGVPYRSSTTDLRHSESASFPTEFQWNDEFNFYTSVDDTIVISVCGGDGSDGASHLIEQKTVSLGTLPVQAINPHTLQCLNGAAIVNFTVYVDYYDEPDMMAPTVVSNASLVTGQHYHELDTHSTRGKGPDPYELGNTADTAPPTGSSSKRGTEMSSVTSSTRPRGQTEMEDTRSIGCDSSVQVSTQTSSVMGTPTPAPAPTPTPAPTPLPDHVRERALQGSPSSQSSQSPPKKVMISEPHKDTQPDLASQFAAAHPHFDPNQPLGTLIVTVVNGSGLPSTDMVGKCDPYVCLSVAGQTNQTSVAIGNNPHWDEKFEFLVPLLRTAEGMLIPHDLLLVDVVDKDRFGNDDLMGKAQVRLQNLTTGMAKQAEIVTRPTGKVKLMLLAKDFGINTGYGDYNQPTYPLQTPDNRPPGWFPQTAPPLTNGQFGSVPMGQQQGQIRVRVVKAMGICDNYTSTYVQITVGEKTQQTTVKPGPNIQWNEEFILPCLLDPKVDALQVDVRQLVTQTGKDLGSVGRSAVNLDTLLHQELKEISLNLQNGGTLVVQIQPLNFGLPVSPSLGPLQEAVKESSVATTVGQLSVKVVQASNVRHPSGQSFRVILQVADDRYITHPGSIYRSSTVVWNDQHVFHVKCGASGTSSYYHSTDDVLTVKIVNEANVDCGMGMIFLKYLPHGQPQEHTISMMGHGKLLLTCMALDFGIPVTAIPNKPASSALSPPAQQLHMGAAGSHSSQSSHHSTNSGYPLMGRNGSGNWRYGSVHSSGSGSSYPVHSSYGSLAGYSTSGSSPYPVHSSGGSLSGYPVRTTSSGGYPIQSGSSGSSGSGAAAAYQHQLHSIGSTGSQQHLMYTTPHFSSHSTGLVSGGYGLHQQPHLYQQASGSGYSGYSSSSGLGVAAGGGGAYGRDGVYHSSPQKYGHSQAQYQWKTIQCDSCNQHPLIGVRYKCNQCTDFDLCGKCFRSAGNLASHDRTHTYSELHPSPTSNTQ